MTAVAASQDTGLTHQSIIWATPCQRQRSKSRITAVAASQDTGEQRLADRSPGGVFSSGIDGHQGRGGGGGEESGRGRQQQGVGDQSDEEDDG
ncbi:hypothetical protein HK405_001815, partial [Cladochytrium tenue]